MVRQREIRMTPPNKGERHRRVDERRPVMQRQKPYGGGVRCYRRQLPREGGTLGWKWPRSSSFELFVVL